MKGTESPFHVGWRGRLNEDRSPEAREARDAMNARYLSEPPEYAEEGEHYAYALARSGGSLALAEDGMRTTLLGPLSEDALIQCRRDLTKFGYDRDLEHPPTLEEERRDLEEWLAWREHVHVWVGPQ